MQDLPHMPERLESNLPLDIGARDAAGLTPPKRGWFRRRYLTRFSAVELERQPDVIVAAHMSVRARPIWRGHG